MRLTYVEDDGEERWLPDPTRGLEQRCLCFVCVWIPYVDAMREVSASHSRGEELVRRAIEELEQGARVRMDRFYESNSANGLCTYLGPPSFDQHPTINAAEMRFAAPLFLVRGSLKVRHDPRASDFFSSMNRGRGVFT